MFETYRGVVYPNQADHMGHMNVQWYTSKFDEATWHLFSKIGLTNSYIKENLRGMAALEQTTKYKAEVMPGDLLVIRSEILELNEKTIKFKHYMFDCEKESVAATSELLGIHIDTTIRKGTPFPGFVRENFNKLIADS